MSPRPIQSTGRPNTPVIGADWDRAHAYVAAGTMRGVVSLRTPGTTQSWDPATEQMVATPKAPYASQVAARIQQLAGEARTVVTADDDETVVDYLVQVPHTLIGASVGDLVDVTAGDPVLVGQSLRVVRVGAGTERFTRDLFCTHN